jgi:uncharacterized protein (TIGR00369 family)
LVKSYVDDKSHIEFDVRPEHTGYPGILHGGITCVLMDEVMFHAIARLGVAAVTVTLAVSYRRPALTGYHLVCDAWVSAREEDEIEVSAKIVEAKTQAFIAEGKGWFKEVDPEELKVRASTPVKESDVYRYKSSAPPVRIVGSSDRPKT